MGSSDSCLGDNMGGVKGSAGLGGGAFGEDGGVATSWRLAALEATSGRSLSESGFFFQAKSK